MLKAAEDSGYTLSQPDMIHIILSLSLPSLAAWGKCCIVN